MNRLQFIVLLKNIFKYSVKETIAFLLWNSAGIAYIVLHAGRKVQFCSCLMQNIMMLFVQLSNKLLRTLEYSWVYSKTRLPSLLLINWLH